MNSVKRSQVELKEMIESYKSLRLVASANVSTLPEAQALGCINSALVDLLLEAAGSNESANSVSNETQDLMNQFEAFAKSEEKVTIIPSQNFGKIILIAS